MRPGLSTRCVVCFLVPTPKELQLIVNKKSKRVIFELLQLIEVIVSVDSASQQTTIGSDSIQKIEEQMQVAEDAMNHYWGKGVSIDDTGVNMPDFAWLGTPIPPIESKAGARAEPSAARPHTGRPDVADTKG